MSVSGPSAATGISAPRCTLDTPDQCLNGVSSGVTGGDSLRGFAEQLKPGDRAKEREDARLASAPGRFQLSGRAAGEMGLSWGVWASGAYTDFDGNPVFGTAITRFDGQLFNGLAGADVTLADRFVLGVALGYESSDTDTDFNLGNITVEGTTVAPYGVVILNDYASIDAAAGYASLDNDQSRIDPAASAPGAPVFLSARFDSRRWFVAANLNLSYPIGDLVVSGQLGVLKTQEDQDGYTETGGASSRTVRDRRVKLSEGHVSLDAAYSMGAFEPFARVSYVTDFSRDDGQNVGGLPGASVRTQFDDNAWRLAAGVRYYGARFSTSAEVQTEQGRANFDSTGVRVSVRGDF